MHRFTSASIQSRFVGVAILLTACGLCKSNRFEDEIGTARVSVVSVAPLSRLQDTLSPQFKIDSDEALKEVAPFVRAESTILSKTISIAATAGVGSNAAGAVDGGAAAGANPAEVPDGGTPPGDLSAVSPLTRYQLATALYQGVQLLNQSLQSFQTGGRDVFIIGVDVSLLPVRNAEYDANVFVSFAVGEDDEKIPLPQRNDIEIIPLISQDDVELSRHQLSIQKLIELAFGLAASGTVKQTPFEILAKFGIDERTARSVLGRDFNALQVVSRASSSALWVHFGAAATVSPEHTLYPQTKRIYAALVMPEALTDAVWEHHKQPLQAYSHCAWRTMGGDDVPLRAVGEYAERAADKFEQLMGKPGLLKPPKNVSISAIAGEVDDDGGLAKALEQYASMSHEKARASTSRARAAISITFARASWSKSPFWLPPPPDDEVYVRSRAPVQGLLDGNKIKISLTGRALSTELDRWWLKIDAPAAAARTVVPEQVRVVGKSLVELTFNAGCPSRDRCAESGALFYERQCRRTGSELRCGTAGVETHLRQEMAVHVLEPPKADSKPAPQPEVEKKKGK